MTRSGWVVGPEQFLQYLQDVNGLPRSEMRLPPRMVMVFGGQDLRAARRALRANALDWHPSIWVGRARNQRVAVVRSTVGAPAAAIQLEEAAVLGVRRIVTFGACGSLASDLPIGSVVLLDRAYSDEGTSRHYGGGRWSRPDASLMDALRRRCHSHSIHVREGGAWTTDAPYRESRTEVRRMAEKGVVAVDMEASAVFTVARRRGVRAASLFVVSDELGGDGWNAGFRDPRFLRAKRRALAAVLDAIGRESR